MDMDALITEVARRHRFVLSPDDPALAVVTLVELAGRELEARLAQVLATADLSKQAEVAVSGVQMACDRVAREVAMELRRQMDAMNAQVREELTACLEHAVTDPPRRPRRHPRSTRGLCCRRHHRLYRLGYCAGADRAGVERGVFASADEPICRVRPWRHRASHICDVVLHPTYMR